jgi:Protein of unknown function (DUF3828)
MSGVLRRAGWGIVLGAALLVMMSEAGPARAESASPRAFIDAIYKPYLAKTYRGADTNNPANVRRYFEPKLANAIIADMAAAVKRNEVPTLDGDPFIDAQDWEIADLAIDIKPAGPTKARATVDFTNFRKPKTVTLDLVKTAQGWRIADIMAPSGSIGQLFKVK